MGMRKSTRLNNIVTHLKSRRAGFRPSELARIFEVSVRTIERDLNDIQSDMGMPLDLTKDGRYALVQSNYLNAVHLDLQEARALLIATRLFLRYSDESDPSATLALQKLARIMPEEVREQVTSAAEALSVRPLDAEFSRNLWTVTEAWARRRVLRLSYRSAGRSRPKEIIMCPYFLEPSAAGFATYIIGYSRTHQAMRTLKVERIVSAEKTADSFQIPKNVDLDQLLGSAWGIIWGEGTVVRIRFDRDVAWRVRESTWHPTQSLEEMDDGSVVMRVTVATTMEIGRWVRGWGDKAEVLEPITLREELRDEAVRLARRYTAKVRVDKKRRLAKKREIATVASAPLLTGEASS